MVELFDIDCHPCRKAFNDGGQAGPVRFAGGKETEHDMSDFPIVNFLTSLRSSSASQRPLLSFPEEVGYRGRVTVSAVGPRPYCRPATTPPHPPCRHHTTTFRRHLTGTLGGSAPVSVPSPASTTPPLSATKRVGLRPPSPRVSRPVSDGCPRFPSFAVPPFSSGATHRSKSSLYPHCHFHHHSASS